MKFMLLACALFLAGCPACEILEAKNPASEVRSVLAEAERYVNLAAPTADVLIELRAAIEAEDYRAAAQLTYDILDQSDLDVPAELMLALALAGR